MKKLTQGEWVAVGLAIAVVVGTFYFPSLLSKIMNVGGQQQAATAQGTGADQNALSDNQTNAVTTQTKDGLIITDEVAGNGVEAVPGKSVTVHYVGTFENGTKFDSSIDRGTPFTFTLGAGQVIPGWDEGIVGMKVGGKRHLVIPPNLGYGSQTYGPIPGNSTLIFDVELLGVK